MGQVGAFLEHGRVVHRLRPVEERTRDFNQLYIEVAEEEHRVQASRCMMCGVAFCQAGISFGGARPSGCPLHNLIPEWNDLVWKGRWSEAAARLALTNPFPEFTGRVCPALCEAACNLGTVEGEPTAIHDTELAISDFEWAHGGPARFAAASASAGRVAVVGSGPAGLACAWELARRGFNVDVWERDDRAGGLLMYGIPQMKLEKRIVERRIRLMEELGITFHLGSDACDPDIAERIARGSDAVVIATGAREARTLNAPGIDASGVYQALEYLSATTRAHLDGTPEPISAKGKDVVVIGGGDTGNDCLGTAVRQGARSVRQLEVLPEPPGARTAGNPWPEWPGIKRTDYGQEEAIDLMDGEMRRWSCDTVRIEVDAEGAARGVTVADLRWEGGAPERVAGSEETLPAQLVLIACGFTGPERGVFETLGCTFSHPEARSPRPLVIGASHRCVREDSGDSRDTHAGESRASTAKPVFTCGDARSGASLVVSAIADALVCADEVARALSHRASATIE